MPDLTALVADVSGWQDFDVSSLARDGFVGVIPKYTEDMSSASGSRAHAQCASARAAGMTVFAGYDFAGGSGGAAQCDALLAAFGGDAIHRAVCDAEVGEVSAEVVVGFGRRAREWNPDVRPILYGSAGFIPRYAGTPEIADLFDLWVAAYTAGYDPITAPRTPPPASPAPFAEYVGWQFTSSFPSSIGHIDASLFDAASLGDDMTPDQVEALIEAHVFGPTAPEFGGVSRFEAHLEDYVNKPTVFGFSRFQAWFRDTAAKFGIATKT